MYARDPSLIIISVTGIFQHLHLTTSAFNHICFNCWFCWNIPVAEIMRLGSRAYFTYLSLHLYLKQVTKHTINSPQYCNMTIEASLNKPTGYEPGTAHLKLETLLPAPKFSPLSDSFIC
jgi:hypothetical protein